MPWRNRVASHSSNLKTRTARFSMASKQELEIVAMSFAERTVSRRRIMRWWGERSAVCFELRGRCTRALRSVIVWSRARSTLCARSRHDATWGLYLSHDFGSIIDEVCSWTIRLTKRESRSMSGWSASNLASIAWNPELAFDVKGLRTKMTDLAQFL